MHFRNEGLSLGEVSQKICQMAVDLGCPDNVTLMIVDLNQYYSLYLQQSMNEHN